MKNKTQYFDNLSQNYTERSNGLLWSLLREPEKKSIEHFLPSSLKDKDVLEIGPGTGHYTYTLSGRSPKTLTCVDVSQKMLNKIDIPNCYKIHTDIEKIDVDKKFDLILCAGVLEFTYAPEKALNNISNMLLPNGIFITLYPRKTWKAWPYKKHHESKGINCQLFETDDIRECCKVNGLEEVEGFKCSLFSYTAKFKKNA